jgi:hypothetical protein
MPAGETAEVGIIGHEGMSGLPMAFGQSSSNEHHSRPFTDPPRRSPLLLSAFFPGSTSSW